MIDYATVLHLSICLLLSVTLCIDSVLEQSYWEAEIPGVESELNFNITTSFKNDSAFAHNIRCPHSGIQVVL